MSRLALIVLSVVVGLVLSVGATFAAVALATSAPVPTNQACCTYGT